MGLKATSTRNPIEVRRYVWFLCILGATVIVSRLVWIADMILQAKSNIRKYYDPAGDEAIDTKEGGENNGNQESMDDYYGSDSGGNISPKTLLLYFSVQIIIVALIYSSTWVFCVSRAVRYRDAVDSSIASQIRPTGTTVSAV